MPCLKILTFGSREDSIHFWLETRRGDWAVCSLSVHGIAYVSIGMERVSPDMHKEMTGFTHSVLCFVFWEISRDSFHHPGTNPGQTNSLPMGQCNPLAWHACVYIIVLAANSVRTLSRFKLSREQSALLHVDAHLRGLILSSHPGLTTPDVDADAPHLCHGYHARGDCNV